MQGNYAVLNRSGLRHRHIFMPTASGARAVEASSASWTKAGKTPREQFARHPSGTMALATPRARYLDVGELEVGSEPTENWVPKCCIDLLFLA